MKKILNDKAFTLVELLAVVAILALLSGLVAPRVIGVIADSKERISEADIAIVQNAVDRYLIDYEKDGNDPSKDWPTVLAASKPENNKTATLLVDNLVSKNYLREVPSGNWQIDNKFIVSIKK